MDPAEPLTESKGTSTTVSSGSFSDESLCAFGFAPVAVKDLGTGGEKTGGAKRDEGNIKPSSIKAEYQFSNAARPSVNRRCMAGNSGLARLSVNVAVLDDTETDTRSSLSAIVPRTIGAVGAVKADAEEKFVVCVDGVNAMNEGVLGTDRTDGVVLTRLAPLKLRFLSRLTQFFLTNTSILSNK